MADIQALLSEQARLKESLRIKLKSLDNIDPRFSMNAPYIRKLKSEVDQLNADIAQIDDMVAATRVPTPVPPTQPPASVPDQTPSNVSITVPDSSNPTNANSDGAAEGGNTAANALNAPPVVPNEDGAAEGGNTAANVLNAPPIVNDPGPSRDDDGNLQPGWELDDNNNPVFVGFGQGVSSIPEMVITASRIPKRDSAPQEPPPPADWRVRISIAKGSKYFYNDLDPSNILLPLEKTNGVIFPYTPTISVSYSAQYDQQTLPHSNFKSTNYGSSSVDSVTVGGDFTAQDVNEANYLLAVIHFFRSATKMFYGQDQNPARGVPPPLLYLSGLGQYQFDNHPMVLQSFNYSLPNDVDYINAYPGGAATSFDGTPLAPFSKPAAPKPNAIVGGINRLLGVGLKPGGMAKPPIFITPPIGNNNATRVPTKISISLTFLPVVTRRAISNEFSLKKYASGQLLRGSVNPGTGGGVW